jgi:hypothetical protein
MIVTDMSMQTVRCTVCKEVHEIPRQLLRDQHGLLEMTDEIRRDHRECAANPDNLKLAIAHRMFRKRIEHELAKGDA